MPLYEIEHSLALSVYQKEILAKRITSIHSRLFTTPSLFVNIRFLDKSGSEHFNFVGGKRVGFQLLLHTVLCVITAFSTRYFLEEKEYLLLYD